MHRSVDSLSATNFDAVCLASRTAGEKVGARVGPYLAFHASYLRKGGHA